MKVIQSSFFRALCSIAIGMLLIKYREQMMTWMVISIGVLFLLSGLVACIAYYVHRSRYRKRLERGVTLIDSEGNTVEMHSPVFPIVGIGSILLGLILALMPTTFISWLMYILAALLILCSLNQFFTLASARIGFLYWIMPVLLLIVAIVIIAYPETIASAPLFFIGWCMVVSGIVECVNALKVYFVRRKMLPAETLADENL